MPAEASRLAPTCFARGKVISTKASAVSITAPLATRASTLVWVWMRRAARLSSTSAGCISATPCATPVIAPAPTAASARMVSTPSRCCTPPMPATVSGTPWAAISRPISGNAQRAGLSQRFTTAVSSGEKRVSRSAIGRRIACSRSAPATTASAPSNN